MRQNTGRINPALSTAEHIAGAAPLAAVLPGGAIAGGAMLGAADAGLAADPNLSGGDRLGRAAVGGALGAAGGAVLKGAGNVAQRTGLTDVVGKSLRIAGEDAARTGLPGVKQAGSVASSIGNAIGTKGAANSLLADRQSLIDKLSGSEKSAAQTMLDHVEAYKQQAKSLYGKAREDQQVVDNPAVRELLDHPSVQKAYDWAKRNFEARGGEIPTRVEAPAAAEEFGTGRVLARARTEGSRLKSLNTASDAELAGEYKSLVDANAVEPVAYSTRENTNSGVSQYVGMDEGAVRAGGRVASRNKSVSKVLAELEKRGIDPGEAYRQADAVSFDFGDNAPATYAHGAETISEVPNPEILSLTKRGLSQIAQGYQSDNAISREEALTALPLVNQLRDALHSASPAWKDADAFYAHAKGFEDAFQKAFGAQQKVTAGGLDPKKLRSPEAIQRWVDKAQGTPTGIARASGQQAGASARLSDAMRNAPIEPDIARTIEGANGPFKPSPSAAAMRRPAFGSANDDEGFTSQLGQLLGKKTPDHPTGGLLRKVTSPFQGPNPLSTPSGTAMRTELASQLADPAKADAIRAAIESSKRGRDLLPKLAKLGLVTSNAAVQP